MKKNKNDYLVGAKILIVDDIMDNLKLLGSLLRIKKASISIAQNGEQAIKLAEKTLPDLILMDVMMPIMDGFEASVRIKNIPKLAEIPIIFITAKSETDQIATGFQKGGVDYITKPFEVEELIARITTHLELKYKKDALEKANQDKDKFLSILSHDLRSPYSGIIGILDVLKSSYDELSPEDAHNFIELLDNAVHQQYDLLNRLLEWGNLIRQNIDFYPESNNLKDFFLNVAELVKASLTNKKITLVHNFDKNIILDYDQNMILTVLRNLLSNAIKFSYEGSEISAGYSIYDDKVVLYIKDNGIGMSKMELDQLFMNKNIVSRHGTNNEKGTGLGLLFCRDVLKMHNGRIYATSEEGAGSTFYVELPVAN